jgi:PAS domain-containing protein
MAAPVPVEVTLTPITLRGEVILHTLWRDISERRVTENRLRLLAGVFEHSAEAIMVSDRDNRILEVNKAFCRLTGYSRRRGPRQRSTPPVVGALGAGRVSRDVAVDQEQRPLAGRNLGPPQGRQRLPEMAFDLDHRAADGNIEHYIGSFVDISERKAAEEKINHLAHFDTLTDLPNRSNLQGRLEQALASARRDGHRRPWR